MIKFVKIPVLEAIAVDKTSNNRALTAFTKKLFKAMVMYTWDYHHKQPMTSADNIYKPKTEQERLLWEKAIKQLKADIRKIENYTNYYAKKNRTF